MRIYQQGLLNDDRLGESFGDVDDRLDDGASFLLIVHHFDRQDALATIDDFNPQDNNSSCKGILFVKGVAYGGLENEAERIEQENSHRVHFLSYAVEEESDIAPKRDQWDEFFRQVEEENHINWNLIDRHWPANLVALYMLACAVEDRDSSLEVELQDDAVEEILREANQERQMHSEQEEELLDPRWHSHIGGKPLKSVIETCLREASPHANR